MKTSTNPSSKPSLILHRPGQARSARYLHSNKLPNWPTVCTSLAGVNHCTLRAFPFQMWYFACGAHCSLAIDRMEIQFGDKILREHSTTWNRWLMNVQQTSNFRYVHNSPTRLCEISKIIRDWHTTSKCILKLSKTISINRCHANLDPNEFFLSYYFFYSFFTGSNNVTRGHRFEIRKYLLILFHINRLFIYIFVYWENWSQTKRWSRTMKKKFKKKWLRARM